MRWHTVSDLHVDYPENMAWVTQLSSHDFTEDVLLVPGDISADIRLVEEVLAMLKARFSEVFFVPGNHDCWVGKGSGEDSMIRFERLRSLCASLGVRDSAAEVGGVQVVPIFSWYDFSFGEPDSDLRRRWADFRMCRWPADLKEQELAKHFHQLSELPEPGSGKVISMSHYLPDRRALPERVQGRPYFLLPVLGAESLGEIVRTLNPDYHIFGHTHLNNVAVLGDTTYVNNAYGYPSEGKFTRKRLLEIHLAP